MRGNFKVTAALLISAACSTNSVSPVDRGTLPSVISECETHTAKVCGNWMRNPGTSTYTASWSQGSAAQITVRQWSEDVVEFERHDTGGPTPHMIARYLGMRHDNSVSFGQVRWVNEGLTIFGTWDATW